MIGDDPGSRWLRVTIPGQIRRILPRIAWILANEIWLANYHGCPVRFAVPVNMRPRGDNILSTGNLSNLIYLDITPDSSPDTIAGDIKTQLANKHDGMLYWGDRFIRYFPLTLIENAMKKEIQTKQDTNLYRNSGIISNVGAVPLEDLEGGGFRTTNITGLPIGMGSLPFFLGIIGTTEQTELIMGMANNLANGGRLENIMSKLADQLSSL